MKSEQNENCSMEMVKDGRGSYIESMTRYGKRVVRLNGFDDKVLNGDDASKYLATLQKAVDWAKGKKNKEE